MLIANAYNQCPHCLAVQEVEYAISGSNFHSTYWSDGFEYTPLWIDKPKIIKCWNCGKLLWAEELAEYSGETENWYRPDRDQSSVYQINPDKPFYKRYDKLSQEDYHHILENSLYQESLTELEVRLLAFWARNDRYRYPAGWFDDVVLGAEDNSPEQIDVTLQDIEPNPGILEFASVREIRNMKAMLEMLAAPTEEGSKYLQAELLRELGRFEEALQVLDSIPADDGNGEIIIKAQRSFCAQKCTCVRMVEFPQIEFKLHSPEDEERDKQQKEIQFQKWKAIVADKSQ